MTPCPHCNQPTIGYFAKHGSWSGGPVKCRACGGLSYMPTVSSGPSIYGRLLLAGWPVVAIATFLLTGSMLIAGGILAGGLAAFLVAHEVVLRRTKLIPVTAAAARESRRYGNIFVGIVFVAILVLVAVRTLN